MRNRTRSDQEDRPQRPANREREDDDDTGRRVRIPKIQYRFIKELDERGVSEDARKGALAMADKIKRYPLDERAVMGSWERFTKKAIAEYKAGGPSDARDRQHIAYAVLFSSLRDKPARDVEDLKSRVRSFETDGHRAKTGTHASRENDGGGTHASRNGVSDGTHASRAEHKPEQRELLARERPVVDQQIDTTLERLRELPSPLRATIEASARDMIVEGHHTWRSAREALPDAIKELREDRTEKNTVHTFTLALIAKSPSQGELRAELDAMREADRASIADEARARLERYPPLETGIADVRRDAVAAGIKNAVSPSPSTRRDALVLAEARDQIETLADPKRLQWDGIGDDLAERLT